MAYNTKGVIKDNDGHPISQYFNVEKDEYEAVEGSYGANKVMIYKSDGTESQVSLVPILDKLSQLTGTVIDEETRKSNEIQRQYDEVVRNNDEIIRNTNEDIRNVDESERNSNEIQRQSDEIRRDNDETVRQSDELIRNTNEVERKSNEIIRENNEVTRKSDEVLRITLYEDLLDKVATGHFKGEKGDTGNGLEFMWEGTSLGIRVVGEVEYVFVDLRGEKGETGSIDSLDSTHIESALGFLPKDYVAGTNVTIDGSTINASGNVDSVNGKTGVVEITKEDIGLNNVDNVKQASKVEHDVLDTKVNEHLADITNEQGRHGIRYFDERLEVRKNGKWELIKSNKPDPTTWKGVQEIVRRGLANDYFTTGDQIMSNYGDDQIIWEVIGIDVDTPADSQFQHSMSLQTKDCLHDVQFDAPEPTNPDSNRKSNGNNRYIHSALRQWLNSDEVSFNWQSQHQYDAKPTNTLDIYDSAGFLNKLDPELTAVIGLAKKNVAKNTVTDGGGQESFTDKVFLLSQKEVDLGEEGVITGESVYPLYNGVANAGRIKQLNGSPRYWWLRSPNVGNSGSVRGVLADGALNNHLASLTSGVSPACVII